ncbi:SPOR domain-containing protein [Rhodobacter capsulatus]|uniref:SPOR domain-containing protein n=1 Tax=Rhodobacter capsulatus TaxID=1061 RepID=UPI004027D03E
MPRPMPRPMRSPRCGCRRNPRPRPQPPAAPRYVQVGSFAVAGNAAAAKARLAAAGLPVSSARTGRGLTVVLAGPFADARQALATVRNAGFAEGLLR